MAEQRTCIACEGPADFTFNVVAYKLGSSPKVTVSTRSIGVCTHCVEPHSPHYDKFGRILACWLFQVRNELEAKEKEQGQQQPDQKSAASGARQ